MLHAAWGGDLMGWSFRKSINLGGGFRINLSKDGVGFSFGPKGNRISVGPRGPKLYQSIGSFRRVVSLASGRKTQSSGPAPVSSESGGSTVLGCLFLVLSSFGITALFAVLVGGCDAKSRPSESPRIAVNTQRKAGSTMYQPKATTAQETGDASKSTTQPKDGQPEAEPKANLKPEPEPEPVQEPQLAPARLWNDSSGKFTVMASLIAQRNEKVCLRKADGSTVEVAIDRLSDDDKDYLDGLIHVSIAHICAVIDGDIILAKEGRKTAV